MRFARVLLLVVLVVSGSGCFGGSSDPEGPRLAQPTDRPAAPPTTPTVVTQRVSDLNDPGYVITSTWRVGDGWDYVSNGTPSRFRNLRVVDEAVVNGTRFVRIEEVSGKTGNAPAARSLYWVDTTSFGKHNETDVGAGYSVYEPPAPLRYFRNGTYRYNETGYFADGRLEFNHGILANSAYLGLHPVRMGWGTIQAGKVDHRILASAGDRTTRLLVEHWVWDQAAAPVLIRYDGSETFRLVAYKAGENSYSVLS